VALAWGLEVRSDNRAPQTASMFMRTTRARGLPWQRNTGSWAAAGWYAAVILGAGVALVTSIPLAARISLARAADGFRPATLTVERVASPRRGMAGRYVAYGRLADGSEARVALDGLGRRPPTSLAALEQQAGTRPARLPVMVNDRFTGTWMDRQRVQWPEAALRDRALGDVARLLAMAACSLAVAVFAWRRLRRLA
jgi:hypothetical protein